MIIVGPIELVLNHDEGVKIAFLGEDVNPLTGVSRCLALDKIQTHAQDTAKTT